MKSLLSVLACFVLLASLYFYAAVISLSCDVVVCVVVHVENVAVLRAEGIEDILGKHQYIFES